MLNSCASGVSVVNIDSGFGAGLPGQSMINHMEARSPRHASILIAGMGAAGDMLGAALYELLDEDERAAALRELNALRIPHVLFDAEPAVTCGVAGTRFHVYVDGAEEAPRRRKRACPRAGARAR